MAGTGSSTETVTTCPCFRALLAHVRAVNRASSLDEYGPNRSGPTAIFQWPSKTTLTSSICAFISVYRPPARPTSPKIELSTYTVSIGGASDIGQMRQG